MLGAVGGTASLVGHEFGHVRAARRLAGVRPVDVKLVWLGAATRFEGGYANGREQLRVALAGPLASIAIGASLVPVLFAPLPRTVRSLALLLLLMNLALAAVNLIPANPLDGHKIVIGILWAALGSEDAARLLVRRVARGWIAVELGSLALVLVERPKLGVAVAIAAAGLAGQRAVVRRARH